MFIQREKADDALTATQRTALLFRGQIFEEEMSSVDPTACVIHSATPNDVSAVHLAVEPEQLCFSTCQNSYMGMKKLGDVDFPCVKSVTFFFYKIFATCRVNSILVC